MSSLGADLIGTAWVYYGPPEEGETVHLYYTEIVAVQGDEALLVALLDHARPSRKWWVPIATLTDPFSAFRDLGPASDLDWVRPNRWVMTLDIPPDDQLHGAWQINLVLDAGVFTQPRDGRILSATWFDVRRKFRHATPEEAIAAWRAREANATAAMAVVAPELPAPPPDVARGTNLPSWARLTPR